MRYLTLDACAIAPWRDVGVYEVELPEYFIDDRLPYKDGEFLGYLEEKFAPSAREFATRCAVRRLGGCLYPWECEHRPKRLVRIRIEEFYFDKRAHRVVLVADVDHRIVRIEEPVERDPIDAAMRGYLRLLDQIGR